MTCGVRNAATLMAASAMLLFASKKTDQPSTEQPTNNTTNVELVLTAETLEQTPAWPMDGCLS